MKQSGGELPGGAGAGTGTGTGTGSDDGALPSGETDGFSGNAAKKKRAGGEATRAADRETMRVAARQWSALSRAQAIKAGLTAHQIAYRVEIGRWREPVRGVYVMAGAPHRREQDAMVACLAGPPGTVASHLTAAALFGVGKFPDGPQVTIHPRASGRFKGAQPFRATLGSGDRCLRRGIPCTSPVRTLVDCAAAGLVDGDALWDLVDSALCRKLMQPSRLIRASGRAWAEARGTRRRHLERLERALDVWRAGAPAGSPPEARLQRKLIAWGYPRAERQIKVLDEDGRLVARADVGLRDLKILFEYDSDEHHGPRFWLADDARADRIEELGQMVVPVDRFDLRPSSTRLKEVLDRRARQLGLSPEAARFPGTVPEVRAGTSGSVQRPAA